MTGDRRVETARLRRLRCHPLAERLADAPQVNQVAPAGQARRDVCFKRHAFGGVDVVVQIRDEYGVAIGINTADVIHWSLLSKLAAQDRETLIETCFHRAERTTGQIRNLLKR